MPPKPTSSRTTATESDVQARPLLPLIATAWCVGVSIVFYSAALPNSVLESRLDFLLLLPSVVSAALLPGPGSSFWSVLERIPYWAVALALVTSGTSLGGLLLGRLGQAVEKLHILERLALAAGVGLAMIATVTLALGVIGWLNTYAFWVLIAVPIVFLCTGRISVCRDGLAALRNWKPTRIEALCYACALPFLLACVLGASLPSASFDNREYHLGGPKEFYQDGQISFLEHNVYTSFPFLSEMFILDGMVLVDDWWGGAIVGQVVIGTFALWTTLLLVALGRRSHPLVGAVAALVWLSSPWCYRVSSTIAFVEGPLAFYVVLAFSVGCLYARTATWQSALLLGLVSGAAISCKYPGLVQVAIPAGVAIVAATLIPSNTDQRLQRLARSLCAFVVGVGAIFGPWALKNLLETGNPVYPLACNVFGGVDLDDAWAAKWAGGHSPPFNVFKEPIRAVPDAFARLSDVFVQNDWQTPLVATFAPLAFVIALRRRRRDVVGAAVVVGWLYFVWWAMTHRIDRFWVPMLPLCCFLAAEGACWPLGESPHSQPRRWPAMAASLIAISVGYHWLFIGAGQAGFHQWWLPYTAAQRITADAAPGIKLLNDELTARSTPLLVGEAQIFELSKRPVFNTVFDDSIFQQIVSGDRDLADADQPTAEPDLVCTRLSDREITHVFVNWSEVLRYRETYGYTDFVTPRRLAELVDAGVLKPISVSTDRLFVPWENLSEQTRAEVESWGPELRERVRGVDALRRFDLFEVDCAGGSAQ